MILEKYKGQVISLLDIKNCGKDKIILLVQKAARVEGQLIAYNKVILLLDNIIKTDEGKAHEIKVIPFVRRNKDD